ncbi:MAG: RDD family protein [Frankia sp.]
MTSYNDFTTPMRPVEPEDLVADSLAGWWRRVGASLIDGIITGVVGYVIALATIRHSFTFLEVILGAVYAVAMLGGRGRTVGNLAVRTAVVPAAPGAAISSGGPGAGLGYGKALLRWFVQEILAISVIGFFVDVLWPLWDARKQTVHDKIASTVVVRV